jgi:uncharacterized protein YeaO (DUF488 family)
MVFARPCQVDQFKKKYLAELDGRREAWEPINKSARRGKVTLLCSSRDQAHNIAVAGGTRADDPGKPFGTGIDP